MTIDHKFAIKKLQKLDGFFTIFSPLTRMPYIHCDEETYDDQVYLFSSEEMCKEFVTEENEKKNPVVLMKIQQPQMNGFLNSLYALDVNMVIFRDDAGENRLELEELANRPDMEKLAKEKIPIMNPRLTLTMIYFLQELRRPIKHDMAHLRELEEEMIANLVKSNFILAVEAMQGENPEEPTKVNLKNIKIPYIKNKEGDIYQPLYSDFSEFRKYAGPNAPKLRISSLSFYQLPQFLIKDSKGFVINPAGTNLVLTTEQIQRIVSAYR